MYGKEIKKNRLQLGYTQIEVSKGTGLPQNTISWIESDKGIENINQCVLIADFFNMSLDELVGRTSPKEKSNKTYNNFGTHNGNVKF